MELKIPPLLFSLMFVIFMWGISKIDSLASVESEVTGSLSLLVLIVGFAITISAVVLFRNAETTLNPGKPKSANGLVSAGIYKISRNPMYLGMFLYWSIWALLIGWY